MTERSGPESEFDAIVLAGGGASRLGGVDKPMLPINGRTLLDGVLTACAGARRNVVVGPIRAVSREVIWTREQPPGAGPAAALAAGLPFCEGAEYVIVLAADLPFIDATVVHSLWTTAIGEASDGAVAVDESGHQQWLTACYRRSSLLARLAELGPDEIVGLSLRRLLRGLRLARLETARLATFDCDTWEEVEAARAAGGVAQLE